MAGRPGCIQRVSPGRVGVALAAALAPGRDRLGGRVISLAETTSTNDEARRLAAAGAPEGTIVVADRQTKGRGRLGRKWHSPPGVGLWYSVVLRPPLPLGVLGPLALVVAVGAVKAAHLAGATAARLKWPNDVVAGGRKLGGILTEATGGGVDQPPEFVVAGIGVNVLTPPGGFPGPLAATATSLAAVADGRLADDLTDAPQPAAAFGLLLTGQLDAVYGQFLAGGFAPIRPVWTAHAATIGGQVSVRGAGREVVGRAVGIDDDGRLLVCGADGVTQAVAAGDVTLRPGEEDTEV